MGGVVFGEEVGVCGEDGHIVRDAIKKRVEEQVPLDVLLSEEAFR